MKKILSIALVFAFIIGISFMVEATPPPPPPPPPYTVYSLKSTMTIAPCEAYRYFPTMSSRSAFLALAMPGAWVIAPNATLPYLPPTQGVEEYYNCD
jgi:hypothetical protein